MDYPLNEIEQGRLAKREIVSRLEQRGIMLFSMDYYLRKGIATKERENPHEIYETLEDGSD